MDVLGYIGHCKHVNAPGAWDPTLHLWGGKNLVDGNHNPIEGKKHV